jgi:hypothetical protein
MSNSPRWRFDSTRQRFISTRWRFDTHNDELMNMLTSAYGVAGIFFIPEARRSGSDLESSQSHSENHVVQ